MMNEPNLESPGVEISPLHRLLAMMLGVAQTQLLRVAAELRIVDLVKDVPKSADELAKATGTHAAALIRILRALTRLGLLTEAAPGNFAATEFATLLQSDHPNSLRDYAILMGTPWLHQTWLHLPESVQSGDSAFEALFGSPSYAYLQDHPADMAEFNAAMTAISRHESAALQEAYDFSPFHTVVDVGGGRGYLLAATLRAHPAMRGVLLELPVVAEAAEAMLGAEVKAGRCQIVSGDYLHEIPEGGDLYIVKRVLAQEDDAQARTLLRNIRRAIQPNGRLVLADPHPTSLYGSLMDNLALVVFGIGSGFRTDAELRELLESAGFDVTRTISTASTLVLVEGAPK